MTHILAAAAPGLPAPFRDDLGDSRGLASLVAAAAAPARSTILADHPDAELLAMEGAIAAARQRMHQFDREADQAFERYELPPIPEALIWRSTDRWPVCTDPDKLAVYDDEGGCMSVYDDGVRDLDPWAQQYAAQGDAYTNALFDAQHRARTREIKAAHEAWQAAIERAEDEAGFTAPNLASDREKRLMDELRRRIAATPAGTPDGILVKARAANLSLVDDPSWVERKYLPMLLARWDKTDCHTSRFEILAVSLIADVLRLGPDPTTAGERGAA